MASDPPPDLELAPLGGKPRTVRMWLTTFHLAFVSIDPYTNESAWILPTARRVLTNYEQSDCRVAFLITADEGDAKRFLGPLTDEILTFCDPEREAVKAFGLERLPAFVLLDMGGSVTAAAEGWQPSEWRAVAERISRLTTWKMPLIPGPKDPGPFQGTPALG